MIGLWSTRTISILVFVRNVFWCDLWDCVRVKTHNRIVCNCVASAPCVWACAFSDYQLGQRTLGILNSCVLSPHCGWSCASLRSLALHWTQAYVLSLLWVNMWIFKWPAWPRDFWHSEHLCVLSPLGVGKWFAILPWFDVDREHSAPRCSPIWMIWTLPSALHRSLKTLTCLIEWNMIQVIVSDRY